jgi:hypothetical protein
LTDENIPTYSITHNCKKFHRFHNIFIFTVEHLLCRAVDTADSFFAAVQAERDIPQACSLRDIGKSLFNAGS